MTGITRYLFIPFGMEVRTFLPKNRAIVLSITVEIFYLICPALSNHLFWAMINLL